MFGGFSVWEGRVVITFDTQIVHHFCTVGLAGMMNQVIYLWELQSDPSYVDYSAQSMLG